MIKPEEFVHLHCHTEFSMLDGATQIKPLIKAVESVGQKAVAITDHGVLHGAYYLWDACTDGGKLTGDDVKIKPIIGVEAYVTPGTSRHDNSRVFFGGPYGEGEEEKERRRLDVSARGAYTHMTMWATDNDALKNLNWMQSIASRDRTLGKEARIDRELLNQYAKGLIGTSGCPSGMVSTFLSMGMYKEALREAGELQDIFGKENFYIELMDHQMDKDIERRSKSGLLQIAKELNAPILATNDLHYAYAEDAVAQDALLCINSGGNIKDPGEDEISQAQLDMGLKPRFKFSGSGYYVKSTEEMFELFRDLPEALTNTVEIANRCNVSYQPEMGRFMPHVPVPGDKTEDEYFREQVTIGLDKRFPDGMKKDYEEQAKYEIDTILDMGFPSYFLVVSDFVKWAKENDIFVGPGRGSAAGSLVAFALEITDLDPIEHKLVFERFLNPERISLPDIDIDFEEGGREQVIKYCAEKYGDDNVAQIVTYGKIMAKQALRDAARISGFEYSVGDILSKTFPDGQTLKTIFDPVRDKKEDEDDDDYREYRSDQKKGDEFRAMVRADTPEGRDYLETVQLAQKIEGLTRGWGVHASGVLVSNEKIADTCPTMRRDPGGKDDAIITQFEAHGCEDLGFVKMDFLGLKNLNTSKACLKNIERSGKGKLDILKIPLDDPKTFDLIGKADTIGVFQLDGEGMRSLLRRMRPTKFDDISATIALYRPGPMGVNAHNDFADRKNGRKPITTIGEGVLPPEQIDKLKGDLDDILGDTYGLVVFQEQIQFAARKLAGFSLGQADLLRRAMGKKNAKDLAEAKADFTPGMLKNGYSQAAVDAVWNVFQPFASYAFNRAHTACYGFNAFTNAYMKANYPVEYMAALLTTNENNHAKLGIYLAECARMDIKVEVPDVNRSFVDFAPDGENVLFGLGAIRNVGEGTALEIIKAREEQGKFTSFSDFLNKVPATVCNKRKIESLIKAGAFDKFGQTRRAMVAIHSEAVDAALPIKQKEATGQFDLFESLGMADASNEQANLEVKIPDLPEFNKREKLDFEKEMLGLYVSDHPLSQFAKALNNNADFPLAATQDPERMSEFARSSGGDQGYSRGPKKTVAGLITGVQKRMSKTGKPWAQINLEDLSGSEQIALFGKSYKDNEPKLLVDSIVQVEVTVQVEESGAARLTGSKVEPLNLNVDYSDSGPKEIKIKMQHLQCTPDNVQELKNIVTRYKGDQEVILEIQLNTKKKQLLKLGDNFKVNASSAFYSEVKAIFGNL
jgi:DNA polymerase-3 subunit alpha